VRRASRRPGTPAARALAALACAALGACAPAQTAPPAAAAAPADRPPNVVFIIADDLGYGDLGAYGQLKIRTPRLDRMAREGTRFTQFYAGSTVCAPSRSVLMTGQHTGRTPIRANPGQVAPSRRLARGVDWPIADSVRTLVEMLRERGYATGGFGKWGLGSAGSTGDPQRQGFDRYFGFLSHVDAHRHYPEFLYDDGRKVPLPGNESNGRRTYANDVVVDEAVKFIGQNKARPFFLYVPVTIPHAEVHAPRDAFAPYLDASGKSVFPEKPYPGAGNYAAQPMPRAAYAAMITRMDGHVGRILDALRAAGVDGNTVVFFTSDNGPSVEGGIDPVFFGSSGPLRGVKRDLYEGGIRVPMIAWGPGRVPAGRTSDHPWAMWDVLPTLGELTGARSPAGIDGISMAAAVTGRGTARQHDFLYWEFHERGGKQAVRRGNWKGVRLNVVADRNAALELYDLAADTAERRDVAGEHPDVVRELAAIMAREHTPSDVFPSLEGVKTAEDVPVRERPNR
jgi:arylsulfatase A-like enzyme